MAILKYKKLHPDAQEPSRKTEGAYAWDLYCPEEVTIAGDHVGIIIPLGIAVEVPPDNALFIALRSSTGATTPLRLSNSLGIIDSDYRGEIGMILDNLSPGDYTIKKGQRLCQCYLAHGTITSFVEVDKLSDTERGADGFGSTGR